MLFKQLNNFHPTYNRELLEQTDLLYAGGTRLLQGAAKFLIREINETEAAYSNRLNNASYDNFLSQIVNSYTADIFTKQLSINPESELDERSAAFYHTFYRDSNMQGDSIDQCLRSITTSALLHGWSVVGVDFPAANVPTPLNLAEEEEAGLNRAYLYDIDQKSIINWELDENCNWKWVVIKTEEQIDAGPYAPRTEKLVRFKVWQMVDGVPTWQIWATKCKIGSSPGGEDPLVLLDEGEVSFKVIPIVRLQLQEELQVGRLLGTQCINLFRRKSDFQNALRRCMYSVLVMKKSSDPDNFDNMADPNRGNRAISTATSRGAVLMGEKDDMEFIEPEGRGLQIAADALKEAEDALFRVTNTMAMGIKAHSTVLGRSGASKREDNRAKEIVLAALGAVIRNFVEKLMNVISGGRNEVIDWEVSGLDNYKTVDREELLQEALEVPNLQIPSPTFQKEVLCRIARGIEEDMSTETQKIVYAEISDAIDRGWTPTLTSNGRLGPSDDPGTSQTGKMVEHTKKSSNAPKKNGRRK